VERFARSVGSVFVSIAALAAGAAANSDSFKAQLETELMGAPVFVANGVEIGEVSAIHFDQSGQIAEVRMTMPRTLGLGPKTVSVRRPNFLALRGAVVLDLTVAEVDRLPPVSERD
jgi:hypothetical protein